jgi:hypothetical protein
MVVLAAAIFSVYGCVLCVAAARGSMLGVTAASLAAGVCLASAAVALLMSHSLRYAAGGVAGVLLPMIVRTGLPLVLILIVRVRGQVLVEAGFVYYLVGFYLLALAVEVPMSLPVAAKSQQSAKGSNQKG